MKVLVTGASGLLGSKLSELLIDKGYKVYSGYRHNIPGYGDPIKFDVSDEALVSKVIERVKPDIIIHSAALTNVDKCETDKDLAWRINVLGTRNIVHYSRKLNIFLVYISTDYVFKGDRGLYSEDDPPNPVNYYGFTKLKGEEEVRLTLEEYCIVRPSVIYGSAQASGKVNFALWVIKNLSSNNPINVIIDQWNSPTLNTNLAEMIIEILERRLTGTYHLAGATRISRYEFAKLIAKIFDLNGDLIKPIKLSEIRWTAGRPIDSSLKVDRAYKTLSHKPLEIRKALEILKKEMLKSG